MDRPAAMLHSTKRLGRSASVKRSGASSSSIIWGLTAKKMRSQRPATSSLMVVLQPSSAARASALAAVRLASQTFCGSAALQTARAIAPPMLPQPKKPMVFSIRKTSFPIKRTGEMPPLCLHCKQGRGRNQEESRKMSKLFGKLLIDALRRRSFFAVQILRKHKKFMKKSKKVLAPARADDVS